MALHVIKKGLDLPIAGAPEQVIGDAKPCKRVALIAEDYVGMKPALFVQAGDSVNLGQPLFEDKKTPGVIYTAPGAGTVAGIHRGARRAFQSIVIELNENELNRARTGGDVVHFEQYCGKDAAELDRDQVKSLLLESGLWTAFRTRPYSKVPAPAAKPSSIFVTAMDTNPLSPSLEVIAQGREEDITAGLTAIARLTDGKVYFCKAAASPIKPAGNSQLSVEEFRGPHPSGAAGMHIHLLDPVSSKKTVWHVGLQDVIAMGALFRTGALEVERVVSLAGPAVGKPRLLRTRIGASTDELVEGEIAGGEQRVISGSVLSGRKAMGEVAGFLGRYHQQVSVLRENRSRDFLGWLDPGLNTFSVTNLFLAKLNPEKKFDFTTTTYGSGRAMVPIGNYEKVMPMDILPTFLLRSLVVRDVERAEALGCLELDEEDLALCTFVCPGKTEYGPLLRSNLTLIEKES